MLDCPRPSWCSCNGLGLKCQGRTVPNPAEAVFFFSPSIKTIHTNMNRIVLNIFYYDRLIFCCTSQYTGICASVQVRHWLLIHPSLSLFVQSENLHPSGVSQLYHSTDRVCYCYCRVKISNCYSQHGTNLTKGRNNLAASKLLNNQEL